MTDPVDPAPDTADHRLAHDLATEAGRLLVDVRARLVAEGADARVLKDTGDREAHALLTRRLQAERPADAVLSEEGKDDPARLDARRVWIVDPLDGTREFSEPPRDDWAVHVALAVDGEVVAGAVALPARGITLSTAEVPRRDGTGSGRPRVAVSRTRMPEVVLALAAGLDAETVPMGSAGAKTMAVVLGEVDVYAHGGGQYEWDSAAPVAVARAAGLHCSRLDGSRLVYNRPDPLLPDLIVCRPDLAEPALALLRDGPG